MSRSSFSEEEFIELVESAEQEAALHPRRYLLKLSLLASLGYVVIFGVLLALLGLAGGLVAAAFLSTGLILFLLKKKLIFVVLLAIWVLLRALWVRFDPPEGYRLTRREFPALFNQIDELSNRLKSMKIHRVILDRQLNAAVVQHPQLGILGWHRNYLIIGYPLLLVLSPAEMRSVIAHELGHLSGNHSKFNGWVYRVRLGWKKVMAEYEGAQSWGARVLRRFFYWYSPKFEAYSFALARRNEFEADAIAAALTSPETAARALVNVYATAPYVDERYWRNYFGQADEHAEPPFPPFEGLVRFLRENPPGSDELRERIAAEMEADPHYADTHPSLADRLRSLVQVTPEPIMPEISAAQSWLGDAGQKVMLEFDHQWLEENGEAWHDRHAYASQAREHLQRCDGCELADLSDRDLWLYACAAHEFVSPAQALPLFRTCLRRDPDALGAAYHLGVILLDAGDDEGLEHLARARTNRNLLGDSARIGYQFLLNQNRHDEAEAWWQGCLDQQDIFEAADRERQGVSRRDVLEHPNIDLELLERLVASLKGQSNVGKVWLAQKKVKHFPDDPVFVVAFQAKGIFSSYEGLQERVAERLGIEGHFFVACLSGEAKSVAKKVKKAGKRIK